MQSGTTVTMATAHGPLKAVAERLGKVDFTILWAGQAIRLGREMAAAELTRALAGSALARFSRLFGLALSSRLRRKRPFCYTAG
jgi:hypothetical protein